MILQRYLLGLLHESAPHSVWVCFVQYVKPKTNKQASKPKTLSSGNLFLGIYHNLDSTPCWRKEVEEPKAKPQSLKMYLFSSSVFLHHDWLYFVFCLNSYVFFCPVSSDSFHFHLSFLFSKCKFPFPFSFEIEILLI